MSENNTLPVQQAVGLPANQITNLIKEIREEFLRVNEGQDLDFARMGSWLTSNKKGEFVEKDDETVNFGSHIDVVIGMGEQRFMLWGKKKTPEEGVLIVSETTEQAANDVFMHWLEENPEAAERYTLDDIQSRHLVFCIPVTKFNYSEPVETPVYMLALSPTAKIAYGNYTRQIFTGKYKANGVPTRTALSKVITRITTEERKNPDKESYLTYVYEAIGLFNPEDFKK